MLKEIKSPKGTEITSFYKEELIKKIKLSLGEDSINFIKKHHNLFKTNSPTHSFSNKISISLYDLISENEYQVLPRKLIFFKGGFTHLRLLLSISSQSEIKSFYKKIQREDALNPDNPDHIAIIDVINQHLLDSEKKKNKPALKLNLEFLICLKQMTTDSMKKNHQMLSNAKKEYRLYTEKIRTSSVRFKNKLKEKYDAENEALKINEENKRIEILKRSLSSKRTKVRYLIKRIDLYAKYIDLEQKEKIREISSNKKSCPKVTEKEIFKYKQLLECFKDQKIEVKSIWKEIQKFSNNRTEINKKYSNISEALSQLERSLESDIAYKDNLIKEIKSLNSYAKYIDLEQKEKSQEGTSKTKSSSNNKAQEKVKYSQLLECFKEQKIELKNIWEEIQKFTNKRRVVYKKYSEISEDLLQIEQDLKRDTSYRDDLKNEIKALTGKIKNHQSELQHLNDISDSYCNLESRILLESDHIKRALEIQNKIFNRYTNNKDNNHHDFNFNESRYVKDFSDINSEAEKLCKELDAIYQKNQKILKQADNLSKKMLKDKKKFEMIKNKFSFQIPYQHVMKLRKKISKNGKRLTKIRFHFDKLEESLTRVRREKEDKLLSLKNNEKKHWSMTGQWQIFIELSRERAFADENLLMNIYEKLIELKLELAVTYAIFENSYVCNDEFLQSLHNTHSKIEDLRKDILHLIQCGRESLEKEETHLTSHIKEQQRIDKRYKELYEKFQGSYLDKRDIQVLLYQNSDLEKKLNALCARKALTYDWRVPASKSLDYVGSITDSFRNRLNSFAFRKKWSDFIPRSARVESFPILKTGLIVFLLLSIFSYLLVFNTSNIYDYKNNLLTFNLSTEDFGDSKHDDKIKDISNIPDYDEKITLFKQNQSEGFLTIEKINTLQSNSLNIITSSLFSESNRETMAGDGNESDNSNTLWSNYADIFDNLRFDSPSNAFRLFEIMMNRQALDLTLMDSIQLLYSIRRILASEEGPFFDRLFHDFVELGFERKEAASSILHNNRLIEKTYSKNIHFIYKGRLKPIAMLEEMKMADIENIIIPYIISNYKAFAKFKKISIPENINTYAKNLAQDIYMCAKKFRVPVTSLLTIAHQESFFINLLGDRGKSASPFQIYKPTKQLIFESMRRDGFKIPAKVSNLENHVTFATFMAAYHFAQLIKDYARPIIDPITHNPTALLVNLKKSTKFYNGGEHYGKKVLLKQKKLEGYIKYKMNKMTADS